MANPTANTTTAPPPALAETQNAPAPQVKGPLKVAPVVDGNIQIAAPISSIKQIDIADVDMLITLDNGESIIIPNGAVDALVKPDAFANFSNGKSSLYELFKLSGIAHPAKAGSLRLVTDNIDANPPEATESHQSDELAPPAPIAKTGVGIGNGESQGRDDAEVPATFVPRVNAIPASLSSGRPSITVQDISDLTGNGIPNISADLYTSETLKLSPSGRADLPLGAYDASATPDQLALRASPMSQSTVEKIYGTSAGDTIGFNNAFSSGEGQWSKTLHVNLNNFSTVSSIQIVFSADKIAQIPGFDLTGTGVTRDSPSSNSWHITPTADMLTQGLDVNIVYNTANGVTPVNFAADIVVDGFAGVFSYEVVNTLYLTWRDAVSQDDFTATSDTGNTLLVLPSGGVGTEIFAYDGDDVVNAGAGNDIIHAGAGDDTVHGGTGDDLLEGGLGADVLDGGVGNDTATYQNAGAGIVATLDTTLGLTNSGEAAGDTYISIENLTGSAYADTLAGNSGANILTGGAGNDILIGGAGADTLIGGDGVDTASYIYSTDSVVVNLTSNTGTAGDATGDTLSSIENIIGGQANDTFISSTTTENNSYDGQDGNDTVSYETATLSVTASLTSGLTDVILSNAALGDIYTSIENLTGTDYNDTLIGNEVANTLTGGAGDDTLEGLGGADSFIGGTGTDTVSYAHSSTGVIASLTTAFSIGGNVTATNDAAGDTYSSIENLTGTSYDDQLVGDSNANILLGGDGNDTLEGMGGADTIDGGAGSNTLTFEHSTSFVAVALSSGLSGFSAAGDAQAYNIVNIQHLTGTNFNDTLIGSAEANILLGGAGDDTLEGLGGADTFDGGAGNNTVSYEHSPDLGFGEGITASLIDTSLNTGDAIGDTFTNIQNLTGSAYNDILHGDSGNNILIGGAGDDTLYGMGGTNWLYGGDGNDALFSDQTGAMVLDGGNGDDIFTVGTGYDTTTDNIVGGAGTDTLFINYDAGWRVSLENNETGAMGLLNSYYTNLSGIENVTVSTGATLEFYANTKDNVVTGGLGTGDRVDYGRSIAGINLNLTTGVVTGGSGNDTLIDIENVRYATNYSDVLIGNSRDNTLAGGRGADYIDGGAGIDQAQYYFGASGSVTVSLMASTVNSALGIVFTDIAAGDVLVNIEDLYGSAYSDRLYGNAGNNRLWGDAGDDILEGMAGADAIDGGGGTNTASYANAGSTLAGAETTAQGQGVVASLTTSFSVGPAVLTSGDAAGDTYANIQNLLGSSFNDTLIGNSGNNVLNGGDGNDILEGLAGADFFIGGNGNDTASYAHSTAGVVADLTGTFANTNDAAGDTYSSIENLTGTNFNDSLYGDGNDNILYGGLGTNYLDGGSGIDTVSYEGVTGALTIDLSAGTVTGAGRTDTLVNIERVIGSSTGDTINGTVGNDWIDGGLGEDTINGDSGSDTVSYNSATSGVSVTLGGSNTQGDTLISIENIYGSAYGDILTGDNGDNVIEGNLGNDTLNGGAGTDTVSYFYSSAGVNVNISNSTMLSIAGNSASGGAGNDTLSNFENITGSAYNDILIGDDNNNLIDAGSGDDILVGGAGSDTLMGGSGNDTASYATATSAIAVTINGAGTLGDANGDILSGIENIIGSAYDDTIIGDANNNVIDGGLGNDTINGAAGIDTVTYASASAAIVVNLSNAGNNVSGGAGNDALSNIENIIGSAFDDTIIGDGNANLIEGGSGNDVLNGGNGTDTLSYASAVAGVSVNISAASVLSIAAGTASGGAGNDTLSNFENITGSAYNDILIAGLGNNTLNGGAGDDMLIGGAGADTFIGGTGNDTVSYINATSRVSVSLGGPLTTVGDAAGDTFSSIENLTGSNFDDTLWGDDGNNTLIGGLGNDELRGGNGNDVMDMTQGRDTAYGFTGDDTFLVSVSNTNLPAYINGENDNGSFNNGGDVIQLVGLTSGQNYSLASLAAVTDNVEVLNIRDGVNSTLSLTSTDVQRFVDQGNNSHLFVRAESGDTLNVTLGNSESMQSFSVGSGMDYVIYSGSTQVAAIHWQTA